MLTASGMRIVLAQGTLVRYPEGGGHWSARLQYLLGLRELGHEVCWLAHIRAGADADEDHRRIGLFLRRMAHYGFEGDAVVLRSHHAREELAPETAEVYGMPRSRVLEIIRNADLLWNFCGSLTGVLLSRFKHRVLVDLDPGHLQVSALTTDLRLEDHDTFLTVGAKMEDADCEVPTLGARWKRFLPFVHLASWQPAPDPGARAPFSSVTQWTWGEEDELELNGRRLGTGKRDAYFPYLTLPGLVQRPLELAANLAPDDRTGDRELLQSLGWHLVAPHCVAATPDAYRRYIRRSRGEIGCVKPIFRQLRTGWFSDRSAAYLASGRPVVLEETGFSDVLPTGRGLLAFRDLEEAAGAIRTIDADYRRHSLAARELAEAYLSSSTNLSGMLRACGW